MMLHIDVTSEARPPVSQKWIREVFSGAINNLQRQQFRIEYDGRWQQVDNSIVQIISGEWRLGVAFIEAEQMRRLNEEYHGKDSVTDVLSWGYLDAANPSWHKPKEDNFESGIGWPNQLNEDVLIGEIAVCMDVIRSRANKFGVTWKDELARMLEHSLFHVLGLHHAE